MINQISIDLESLNKDLKDNEISEIIMIRNNRLRKRERIISGEIIDQMETRQQVLKTLKKYEFEQEIALMGKILLNSYGSLHNSEFDFNGIIIKDERKLECLVTSQKFHLTLNSLNE